MGRVKINRADSWFALAKTGTCGLDPMVDRISHQMNKGIDETFDDAGVDFGMLARCDQIHFLACGTRHLTRSAAEASEGCPDRHHSSTGDLIAHA